MGGSRFVRNLRSDRRNVGLNRIDGDRATVRSYFCTMRETEEGPLLYSMGQYLDVFVRCTDGRWRMKERHLSREGVHKSGQEKAAG